MELEKVERTAKNFFNGNVFGILGMAGIWSVLMSLMPYGYWDGLFFSVYVIATVIQVVVLWYYWKYKPLPYLYFESIASRIAFMTTGIASTKPMLSLTYGHTKLFWLFAGILVVNLSYSIIKRDKIRRAMQGDEKEHKTLMVVLGGFATIFVLGFLSIFVGMLTDVGAAAYFSLLSYILGSIFIFMSLSFVRSY